MFVDKPEGLRGVASRTGTGLIGRKHNKLLQGALVMGENKGYIKTADDKGSINISEEVVAIIAATAALEVGGVYSLFHSYGKELANKFNKKTLTRGVKLLIGGNEEEVTIDVFIITMIGYAVNDVGTGIQRAVKSAVESAVGLKVSAVNVHICGVSLKKSR